MIDIDIQKKLNGSNGIFTLNLKATFKPHSFHAIFGKSGCGKTTFFKILAGLTNPDSGFIHHNTKIFFDKKQNINLPTWKRKIGFVFQNYALFPHLNVYKNIIFGLDPTLKDSVKPLITLLDLEKLCNQYPKNLSGGQSQKVALARAVLNNPDILLLDEPFNGLDQNTKIPLQQELKKTLEHFNFTTFMISHDIAELFLLADDVFVLENGNFCRHGKPQEVFLNQHNLKNQLCGKVLSIQSKDDLQTIQILVNHTILQVTPQNNLHNLKIGDYITLDNHFSIQNIKKI